MSIQTEIDRIKNAKADIISALNAKGIAVPEDTAIENIAIYITNGEFIEPLKAGVDLSGKTLVFDTTKDWNFWNYSSIYVTTSGGYVIQSSIGPPSLTVCGVEVYNVTTGGWSMYTYSMPLDAGVVQEISSGYNQNVGELISVKS